MSVEDALGLNEQTQRAREHDMKTREGCWDAGLGQMGWTATTEAGITRWGRTRVAAVRAARNQEASYRDAGMLADVLARTAGMPCCDTTHGGERVVEEVAA